MGTSVYYQSNIIDTEADALVRLAKLIESDSIPALTSDDIQQLLSDHKIATVWSPSTTYYQGDKVVPSRTARNGHMFMAITNDQGATSGVSDVNEPAWPMAFPEEEFRWKNFFSRNITDGTVLWRECGPEIDLWNIRSAAHEGWVRKMGAAATMFDNKIRGNSFNCSQVYGHCKDMAMAFSPVDDVA